MTDKSEIISELDQESPFKGGNSAHGVYGEGSIRHKGRESLVCGSKF